MSEITISAVLACHNEEPFINAWLEETSAYADEILVAVHAPTDATADLIARFKRDASVPIHCEWFPAETVERYGFSLMKNEMIARARGDWITSIDADEEIGLSPAELRDEIEAAQVARRPALTLQWATHPNPPEAASKSMNDRHELRKDHEPILPVVEKHRIFCNRSGIWWRGWIHETLYCHDIHVGRASFPSLALLHHYCYLRDAPPEWKTPLYHYLICRAVDCPALREGTDSWWFETDFDKKEKQMRENAARYQANCRRWFPHMSARVL